MEAGTWRTTFIPWDLLTLSPHGTIKHLLYADRSQKSSHNLDVSNFPFSSIAHTLKAHMSGEHSMYRAPVKFVSSKKFSKKKETSTSWGTCVPLLMIVLMYGCCFFSKLRSRKVPRCRETNPLLLHTARCH